MKNYLRIHGLLISLVLLTACGGGSGSNTELDGSTGSGSTGSGSTGSGSTGSGSTGSGSTGSSSTGSSSTGSSSTGSSSTGSSSTGSGSTGSGSTGSSSTGSGSTGSSSTGSSSTGSGSTGEPSTKVLYDATKTYTMQGKTGTVHIKVTEYHQNNDSTIYNLWDYSFSPTKDSYRIFQDSYSKTVSPPNFVTDEIFEQNAWETLIEKDPRVVTNSLNYRKATTHYHYPETGLSGIRFSSIESMQIDENTTPPTLLGIQVKNEYEDLVTNQDPCSSEIVSKGEILFSAIGEGFWQIGDKLTIEINSNSPELSCGGINTVGAIQSSAITTSTLTAHIPVLTIRGKQFHNVLEITDESSTVAGGQVALSSVGKTYLQYYTGEVVTTDTDCIGGSINSPAALCIADDIIANNVPAIPETN